MNVTASGLNKQLSICPNSGLVFTDPNPLIETVHALKIPRCKSERQEAEHVPAQATVVPSVGDHHDEVRSNDRLGHHASDCSFQDVERGGVGGRDDRWLR